MRIQQNQKACGKGRKTRIKASTGNVILIKIKNRVSKTTLIQRINGPNMQEQHNIQSTSKAFCLLSTFYDPWLFLHKKSNVSGGQFQLVDCLFNRNLCELYLELAICRNVDFCGSRTWTVPHVFMTQFGLLNLKLLHTHGCRNWSY